jgi:hypothetical protein
MALPSCRTLLPTARSNDAGRDRNGRERILAARRVSEQGRADIDEYGSLRAVDPETYVVIPGSCGSRIIEAQPVSPSTTVAVAAAIDRSRSV